MDWDGTLQAFDAPVGPAVSSFSLGIGFPDPVMGVEIPETKSSKGRRDLKNKTKKRLSNNQLEMLEASFQEGIKLDPDRKIRLSTKLGLEQRQVAVWFQNRRVRWKAKQMEVLYTNLRQEFDVTCKEKLKLQEKGRSNIQSSMNEVGFHARHDIDPSTSLFGSDEYDAVTHPFYHSNTL